MPHAVALAAGAALPLVGDLAGMVGIQKAISGPSGVGILPKEYQGGNMSLIMPPQNMAGGGEAGW